jgi:hypothetical protein
MAKVITTELQHSGASGANITLDSSKNVTVENNLTVDGSLSAISSGDLQWDGTSLKIKQNNTWIRENQFRFNCAGDGHIDHYTTGQKLLFRTSASSGADTTSMEMYPTGFLQYVSTGYGAINKSNTGTIVEFRTGGNAKGSIGIGGSDVSFNTSSDYRLKENVAAISDGITRVKQLKPSKFNWIADDTNTLIDGFLAHEVSSVVPNAVTGAKDAVDSDSNPIYQSIDQSKMIPLLTAALKEAITEIETLKTKVAALEAG